MPLSLKDKHLIFSPKGTYSTSVSVTRIITPAPYLSHVHMSWMGAIISPIPSKLIRITRF